MPRSRAYSMAQSTSQSSSLDLPPLAAMRMKPPTTALSIAKRSNVTRRHRRDEDAEQNRSNHTALAEGPWLDSNNSKTSLLSRRTHACMPSWNLRMMEITLDGDDAVSCWHLPERERPTESYASWRSMKHTCSARFFSMAGSWSLSTRHIISTGLSIGRVGTTLSFWYDALSLAVYAEANRSYLENHLPTCDPSKMPR